MLSARFGCNTNDAFHLTRSCRGGASAGGGLLRKSSLGTGIGLSLGSRADIRANPCCSRTMATRTPMALVVFTSGVSRTRFSTGSCLKRYGLWQSPHRSGVPSTGKHGSRRALDGAWSAQHFEINGIRDEFSCSGLLNTTAKVWEQPRIITTIEVQSDDILVSWGIFLSTLITPYGFQGRPCGILLHFPEGEKSYSRWFQPPGDENYRV